MVGRGELGQQMVALVLGRGLCGVHGRDSSSFNNISKNIKMWTKTTKKNSFSLMLSSCVVLLHISTGSGCFNLYLWNSRLLMFCCSESSFHSFCFHSTFSLKVPWLLQCRFLSPELIEVDINSSVTHINNYSWGTRLRLTGFTSYGGDIWLTRSVQCCWSPHQAAGYG